MKTLTSFQEAFSNSPPQIWGLFSDHPQIPVPLPPTLSTTCCEFPWGSVSTQKTGGPGFLSFPPIILMSMGLGGNCAFGVAVHELTRGGAGFPAEDRDGQSLNAV